ncbi:MAG: type II secretion system minor pseudopilin GspJ [Sphingorhabdus sp.]
MMRVATRQSGFTLIEMLVALSIFAMISAAGVALLQSASSTQLAVKGRLDDLGRNARAVALMEADLAQAIARPVRAGGAVLPAFAAQGSEAPGQLFAVTRTGWANLDNAPRPDVQRVAFALERGALVRLGSAMPDSTGSQKTVLLNNVSAATVRFRDAEGNWRSDWSADDAASLPRALELVVTRTNAAPVTLLFLVGTGQADPKQPGEAGGDDAPPV